MTMKDRLAQWLASIALSGIAALAPIRAVMVSVGVLIFADLITGIWAARKRGERISSSIMRRTITKMAVYQTAVVTGFIAETWLIGSNVLPVSRIVAGAIGLVELASVTENLNAILGGKVMHALMARLGSPNDPKHGAIPQATLGSDDKTPVVGPR